MWGEAWRLVQILLTDPTTRLFAEVAEWERPISYETLMLADLFDLTALVNSGKKKPKPHPIRPWKQKKKERVKKLADIRGRTREEVIALLAAARRGEL